MKLQIRTTFDFGKLANKAQNLVDKFVTNTISGESKQMKKRISSGSTITGKMDALKKSAKETRKLRGISGTTPLKATGALLNSIKPMPKGISAKEYGSWQNRGFVTKNRPLIPDSPIYSGKGGKDSTKFNFAGKTGGGITIPARRWLHDSETFKNDKKIVDKFFKQIGKALKK